MSLEQVTSEPVLLGYQQQQMYQLIVLKMQDLARLIQQAAPGGPLLDRALDSLGQALQYIQLDMAGGQPPPEQT